VAGRDGCDYDFFALHFGLGGELYDEVASVGVFIKAKGVYAWDAEAWLEDYGGGCCVWGGGGVGVDGVGEFPGANVTGHGADVGGAAVRGADPVGGRDVADACGGEVFVGEAAEVVGHGLDGDRVRAEMLLDGPDEPVEGEVGGDRGGDGLGGWGEGVPVGCHVVEPVGLNVGEVGVTCYFWKVEGRRMGVAVYHDEARVGGDTVAGSAFFYVAGVVGAEASAAEDYEEFLFHGFSRVVS